MLDPTIAKLLKSGSYATFAEMMSKYRHDLVNRQSNLILTSQIIAKLISRLPDSPSIPEVLRQQAIDIVEGLVEHNREASNEVLDFLWFPREETIPDLEDEESITLSEKQARWQPFDGRAWEGILKGLIHFIDPHMREIKSLIGQLEQVVGALAAASKEDEQAQATLDRIKDELASTGDSFRRFAVMLSAKHLRYDPESREWDTVV
jgi:hypothetical protein